MRDAKGWLKDCVVVGGGPAGLSCALLLARHQRSVVVIDDARPRNGAAQAVNGLIGRHPIPPAELIAIARREASGAGAKFRKGTVESVVHENTHFMVNFAGSEIRARRIVLAYGVRDEIPSVEGVQELYGKGVFHCPTCDGYEIRGMETAALGTGDKVAGLALELLQWARRVTVLTNGQRLGSAEGAAKLEANHVQVITDRLSRLDRRNGGLSFIEFETGRRMEAQALFFTLDTKRSCGLAEDFGCKIDRDKDVIVVDEDFETSVADVYAIGDLVGGANLVAKAAADGAIAAIALHKSLLPGTRVIRS